jgi:hypothetical protein
MLDIGNLEFKTFEFSLNIWIWEKEIENKNEKKKRVKPALPGPNGARGPRLPPAGFSLAAPRVPLPCGSHWPALSSFPSSTLDRSLRQRNPMNFVYLAPTWGLLIPIDRVPIPPPPSAPTRIRRRYLGEQRSSPERENLEERESGSAAHVWLRQERARAGCRTSWAGSSPTSSPSSSPRQRVRRLRPLVPLQLLTGVVISTATPSLA